MAVSVVLNIEEGAELLLSAGDERNEAVHEVVQPVEGAPDLCLESHFEYGTRAAIEGEFAAGETVVVIDDLATTGGTKVETIAKLAGAGLTVRDAVVLIDREQGARESLAKAGYTLHAVATLSELLAEWLRAGDISQAPRR